MVALSLTCHPPIVVFPFPPLYHRLPRYNPKVKVGPLLQLATCPGDSVVNKGSKVPSCKAGAALDYYWGQVSSDFCWDHLVTIGFPGRCLSLYVSVHSLPSYLAFLPKPCRDPVFLSPIQPWSRSWERITIHRWERDPIWQHRKSLVTPMAPARPNQQNHRPLVALFPSASAGLSGSQVLPSVSHDSWWVPYSLIEWSISS